MRVEEVFFLDDTPYLALRRYRVLFYFSVPHPEEVFGFDFICTLISCYLQNMNV